MDVTDVGPFTNVECPHCGKHTRVKREFGPYTLMQRQGIGGMSLVFSAHDNTLDREVAVKILNEEYSADSKRIEAFEEEARITASISHPHVVRVFTTGHAFDRYYIAMELVAGGHLESRIRELGRIPEEELLPLAIQITEGLKAAHARGLLHRDIKPGNILLDADGRAKIVDFGLALVTQAGKATAKEIWATPFYVPPETIEGHEEDFRSDLYALGSTLYHALYGKPPCIEETMSTTKLREAKRNVVPLHKAAPDLSPGTCAAVERAMAYHPDDRFGSYDELLSTLRHALRDLHLVRQVETEQAQRKKSKRALTVGAGAAIAVLAAGVALWMKANPRKVEPQAVVPTPPPRVVTVDKAGIDPAKAAEITARYRFAREQFAAGKFDQALAAFAEVRGADGVQEPTASWAGMEAVVAALLADQNETARDEAAATLEHLDRTKLNDDELKSRLIGLLQPLLNGDVAVPQAGDAKTQPLAEVERLLIGLEHWKRGDFSKAGAAFKKLVDEKPAQDAGWWAAYAPIARDYVEDEKALRRVRMDTQPLNLADCDAELKALAEMSANLRTPGRAREVIEERQLQLQDCRPSLEATANRPPLPPAKKIVPTLALVEVELNGFYQAYRFDSALQRLREVKLDEFEEARYAAWVEITARAGSFIPALEKDLGASASLSVQLRDGHTLNHVTAEKGQLSGIDADSRNKQTVGWGEVTPQALLKLHQQLVNNLPGENARFKRHEAAVAFQWLAGDREVALAAAERLGQQNADFKKRWSDLMLNLK